MALVECKECGKEVSTMAKECPHCGINDPTFVQTCSDCNSDNIQKDVCQNCGAPVEENIKPDTSKAKSSKSPSKKSTKNDNFIIRSSVIQDLSTMVKSELIKLSDDNKQFFIEEFDRKKRSLSVAYLLSFVFFHYAYVGRWPLTLLGWCLFFVVIFWWLVDLFRMRNIVAQCNSDIALEILRDLKIMKGA